MEDAYKQFNRAFQALAYWCGYSITRARDENLREIAAANELFNLMSADLNDSEKIISEIGYSLLQENASFPIKRLRRKSSNSQEYLDICIGQKIGKDKIKPLHYFEIKRLKSGIKKIESDIDKLSSIKNTRNKATKWVIVIGKQKINKGAFQRWIKGGKNAVNITAVGKNKALETDDKNKYYVRRIYRAGSGTRKDSVMNSNFVVILQVA
jgi:hypothetical protein